MKRIMIMTDGGATSNPGRAAAAYIVKDEKEGLICLHSEYIGNATNNVAEYMAVIMALNYVKRNFKGEYTLLSDSKLVVEQLNGNYTVKATNLQPLWKKAKKLVEEMKVKVKWIPREENKLADLLVSTVRRGENG